MRNTGHEMHLSVRALSSSHYLNSIYVIELENCLSWDLKYHLVASPLLWAGPPSTRPGCWNIKYKPAAKLGVHCYFSTSIIILV